MKDMFRPKTNEGETKKALNKQLAEANNKAMAGEE